MEGFTAAKPNTSRWEMKRPACLAAASFLGTTALFIPLYQGWMLPQQSLGKRIFCLGMLLLALLAAALAAQFGCKREVWRCRIVLVLLSSGAAVLVVFGSLERVLPAVRAADGRQAALQVEVLACDVMDYGSRYLVRTVGQGALPSGLKGRVYSFEEPAADEGDRMELTARLETKMENDDRSRNIFFYAFTEEGTLRRTQKHQTVRGRMLAAADSLYDAPVLGMVEGVLFGERENIDRHFAQMLEEAGLVHILSVSGIHISLLASFCNGVFSRGEDNLRRFTGLLALLPVWGYIALAQFAPSAVRAGLMATLSAVGLLLHRERDALSALAVSAVAIVAFSPFSLYSVSFQLSFWVTLGILLCTSPLTRMLEQLRPVAFLLGRAGKLSWKLRGVCATVAASIAATVFSLPLMLFYFQSAAVWSVLSSVLALWAVSPLMILSMLSILLKLLFDAADHPSAGGKDAGRGGGAVCPVDSAVQPGGRLAAGRALFCGRAAGGALRLCAGGAAGAGGARLWQAHRPAAQAARGLFAGLLGAVPECGAAGQFTFRAGGAAHLCDRQRPGAHPGRAGRGDREHRQRL